MIYLDIETYSELDVSAVGAVKYAAHPSTEVLLLCYAVDDGPVQAWDGTDELLLPEDLYSALDAGHELCAHNCAFERYVLSARFREFASLELERWVDSSLLARTCGLPADLHTLSLVLGLDQGEHKAAGAKLVTRFCKPTPPHHKVRRYTRQTHPKEWQEFIAYCRQDVQKTRWLWCNLPHTVFGHEHGNWMVDARINDRGIPIDEVFVARAIEMIEIAQREGDARMRVLTEGAVPSVAAVGALASFCGLPGVAVADVEAALTSSRPLTDAQRAALLLRQECGKASVAKYRTALEVAHQGRVRDALMFYGASRTGRAAGRLLQPQNMQRPTFKYVELAVARETVRNGLGTLLYEAPLRLAGELVRTMIAPPPGRKFVVADLANIEGRMLAWLAGEEWKLQAFREFDAGTGPDIYRLAYSRSFGIPVDEVTKDQRQIGKVMELALGYGGAVGAFETMAAAYGVSLPLERVQALVRAWREAHLAVPAFWRSVETAAIAAVREPGHVFTVRDLKFTHYRRGAHAWLLIRLPSGRLLMYYAPEITRGAYGPALTYIGQVIGSTWKRIDTYGGKLVENITQAAARDVLVGGIRRADNDGFDVVMHAHDEIITECPDTAEWTVRRLANCMTYQYPWHAGLPLAAAGYEAYFYRKE